MTLPLGLYPYVNHIPISMLRGIYVPTLLIIVQTIISVFIMKPKITHTIPNLLPTHRRHIQ
jgi:hypothetical protein